MTLDSIDKFMSQIVADSELRAEIEILLNYGMDQRVCGSITELANSKGFGFTSSDLLSDQQAIDKLVNDYGWKTLREEEAEKQRLLNERIKAAESLGRSGDLDSKKEEIKAFFKLLARRELPYEAYQDMEELGRTSRGDYTSHLMNIVNFISTYCVSITLEEYRLIERLLREDEEKEHRGWHCMQRRCWPGHDWGAENGEWIYVGDFRGDVEDFIFYGRSGNVNGTEYPGKLYFHALYTPLKYYETWFMGWEQLRRC